MLKTSPSLTPLSLCFFNECGVVNLNWFIKIEQCTPDPWIEQTHEPSSICSTKAGGQALHGQLSEGLQHVDLHDYILHDHIFRNTINHWWDRYLRLQQIRGINHWWDRYLRLQQIRGIIHWWDRYLRFTVESEICGSTSTQLVQLPTHSNIPGVSMIWNTGDSEDH